MFFGQSTFVGILIELWVDGKTLQTYIEVTYFTTLYTFGLEVEGKGNGGNSALFNLKDTAILYDLLNLLLWLESLETSIELNIDSASFRFPFSQ